MSNLVNCPRCGALFLKKNNRDVCDKCFKERIELAENIIKYAESFPNDKVHIKQVLEHFKISINELEYLLTNFKLVSIEDKLVMNCAKCGVIMPATSQFSKICRKCANELKQEVLKGLI